MAVVVAVVMVMVMVVMVAMVVMEMVMVVKRHTADGDGGQRQTADGAHALPLSAHSQGLAGDAPGRSLGRCLCLAVVVANRTVLCCQPAIGARNHNARGGA